MQNNWENINKKKLLLDKTMTKLMITQKLLQVWLAIAKFLLSFWFEMQTIEKHRFSINENEVAVNCKVINAGLTEILCGGNYCHLFWVLTPSLRIILLTLVLNSNFWQPKFSRVSLYNLSRIFPRPRKPPSFTFLKWWNVIGKVMIC